MDNVINYKVVLSSEFGSQCLYFKTEKEMNNFFLKLRDSEIAYSMSWRKVNFDGLKSNVMQSLFCIEGTLNEESYRLAKLLNEEKISYDDLIELRMHFKKERPELYKPLFDRVEERLLEINLDKRRDV